MVRSLRSYTEADVTELARAAYSRGEASFDPDLSRAALLVIDMQNEFVKPGWCAFWVPEATRMVSRLAFVIAAARQAGLPVIYTAFGATHRYLDRPRSGPSMPNRYPGEPDEELFSQPRVVPELTPRPEDLFILKPSYGAFYDTPLDTILHNLGRDTVIVTGTLTNLCCGTTARQAYERGYQVVFGADVTATNDWAIHEAELATLRYGFARVLTAAQIIERLAEARSKSGSEPAAV